LAHELGVILEEADNESLKGVSRVDSLEWILNKGGLVLDSQTKLALMTRKNDHYLELISEMGPQDILPGVLEFIEGAKSSGIQIGLGSSSKNAPVILDAIGISDLFDVVIDGNRITLSKPDPEVFLLGASSLQLEPRQCLVVEDAASGVEAGKAGGFPVLGVGNAEVLAAADWVLESLEGVTCHQVFDQL
jgi:beta-phosphoglucomutase